jgi:hypothetical protein
MVYSEVNLLAYTVEGYHAPWPQVRLGDLRPEKVKFVQIMSPRLKLLLDLRYAALGTLRPVYIQVHLLLNIWPYLPHKKPT